MNYLAKNQKYLLGIIGGVGPLSHIEFEKELLAESFRRGARSDQDHPVWILYSASATPDRTQSLLYQGVDSEPFLTHAAKTLENAGADALFVICNTAHGFHENVQKGFKIPWVHLMQITAKYIQENHPKIKAAGVIGTDGTLKLHLYHSALKKYEIKPIAPRVGSETQQMIMNAIYHKEYGIKATGSVVSEHAQRDLIKAADWCRKDGAEVLIAACTEVSLALTEKSYPKLPIVDPLKVAASIALDIASGKRHPKDFMLK